MMNTSDTSDYGAGSRLLHRLALESTAILQTQFDIESTLQPEQPDCKEPHVFVAGLARSGTTALLRALFSTGKFRSLTYRDMPFVLMPNLWAKISKPFRKQKELTERAHGDRILVNFDSPEAFEEVFWRTFCGKDYIGADKLRSHEVDDEVITKFRRYVDLILNSGTQGQSRYLSKNNNNILRLPSIRKAFPNAVIIIPFRDPVQQAISLQRQHERFLAVHKGDSFSYSYMKWLGHHEFGATHKPFAFGDDFMATGLREGPGSVNYWLDAWCSAYSFLQNTAPQGARFLSYEGLCENNSGQCSAILQQAGITLPEGKFDEAFKMAEHRSVDGINEELKVKAKAIYEQLCTRQSL